MASKYTPPWERKQGRKPNASDLKPRWLKPPDGLDAKARQLWMDILSELPGSHFRQSDAPLFAEYIQALRMLDTIRTEWIQVGKPLVAMDDKGVERKSIYLVMMKDHQQIASMLATKLRLCPNSRTAVKGEVLPKVKGARSGLMFEDKEENDED